MTNERIHFIGIGGIGVSALAKYYLSLGARVSGSDLVPSQITAELARLGAYVVIGPHAKMNVPAGVTRIIHTAAVPARNQELLSARARKIRTQSYAEAIGDMTRRYRTVTISGAHGKSTTTAMTALILEEGFLDPTVIVGTKIKEFGNSNFRRGCSTHLVLEADEWNRSFLHYQPHLAVLTNIDAEHLDTYGNVAAVEVAFSEYLAKVPPEGKIIANRDDERTYHVAKKFGKKVVWYSQEDSVRDAIQSVLKVPGRHNVSNALAAAAAARALGVREGDILSALGRFTGAWRRFELKGMLKGAFVFSDYAHHPREITATLEGARERFPMRRIWCLFQPHQHQRLHHLWDDFTSAFDLADRTILLPVYDVAGREIASAKAAVNSEKLARVLEERGKNVSFIATFAAAGEFLRAHVRPGDAVIIMGAGDIYRLAEDLV